MRRIVIAAEISSQDQLNDVAYRLYHHFSFVSGLKFYLFLSPKFVRSEYSLPSVFGRMSYKKSFVQFCESLMFRTVKSDKDIREVSTNAYAVIIYSENYYRSKHALFKASNPKLYWCDPVKTRQEGSNFIQAALDCLSNNEKQNNESESLKKFMLLRQAAFGKYEESALLATGPSVEEFRRYEFKDKFVVACNSTILNKELMDHARPRVLVFADPIFHFGVSQYAESFRSICKDFLNRNPDLFVVIPIKYYALLKSLMHENAEQIIGVPFTKHKPINTNISEQSFYTYTTANILTLLLLPLATTFSKKVNIIGCDGRSLADDSYFWGHGKSVQINDKMSNIQECHPGFFNIDYNEYYFEHCHTLDNFINHAELHGKSFCHLGNTHIPTLAQRSINNSLISVDALNGRLPRETKHLLVEPDGVSANSGHYLDWHMNFAHQLIEAGSEVAVLAREDAEYSSKECEMVKLFGIRSWDLQRGPGSRNQEFPYSQSVEGFYTSLKGYLERQLAKEPDRPLHVFMYYGSVQAIKCLLELQKQFANRPLFFSVCIFHESVNLNKEEPTKNFHPDAKKILVEAAAKMPHFRLFAVTDTLSQVIYRAYEVKVPAMAHPIINIAAASEWVNNFYAKNPAKPKENVVLYLPCRLGFQKNDEKLFDVIRDLLSKTRQLQVKLRSSPEALSFLDSLEKTQELRGRVKVLGELNTPKEYFDELCKADIVFIPYTQEGFYARTSGVLNDAILARKPVITLRGTWLADRAFALRSGLYVTKMDPDSLFVAVRKIVQNYRFFEGSLLKGSSKIRAMENFATLASQVRSVRLNQFSNEMAG